VVSLFGEGLQEGAMCDVQGAQQPVTTDYEAHAEVQQ
jgi:hypothetical protein